MAMMAKMRSLAPAFILTVGVLFVLFMVISDSSVMQALGGPTNDVGSVNGDDITYKEFQTAVDQQREARKQQGQDVDDENMDQFRDQVWDYVISEKLIQQEVNKMGITVSDEEVRDIILGDNPPAFLKQNFIDSTGKFNREQYESALYNPQNEKALIGAEQSVRQYRINEKLQSIILASINVTQDEVLRAFKNKNIYVNSLDYVFIPTSIFPDSTIKITDDDIKKYYDDNIDKYTEKEQRKLDFVIFDNKPSAKDSEIVYNDLRNVKINFGEEDTTDFKYYVNIYSSQPYSIDTINFSALSPEGIDSIQAAKVGDVIGPVPSPGGVALYHLLDVITSKDELVRASHILIRTEPGGDDAKSLAEANQIYDELIAGADFGKIAREKSQDPGSAKQDGDLGWFGRGRMIKEFEEAAFNGKINEVQKPIKTTYGYHIIKVTGKSNKKYIVEKIINPIKESATTRDERYNAAKDFSYLADKNGFEKEANLVNYKILSTGYFTSDAPSIPGLGANKRLLEFAFDNGVNSVSDVYKVQQGYVVTKVAEVKEAGITPFDKIKDQIEPLAFKEIKLETSKNLAEQLKTKLNGNLKKINKLDSKITVKSTGRFNSESSIPGIGRNYAFIETALNSDTSRIEGPIKSPSGYYLLKVNSKSPFDSTAFSTQSSTLRNNLLQQKKRIVVSQWLAELKEKADIVDNRYKFYGY
jgi:peptidyl-prolyl cis-trans isomerase D